MSSPDGIGRRAVLGAFLVVGAGLALGACGFAPVYGPGGAGAALQGRVRPRAPATPDEFAFAARLADRLGPPQAAAFGLDYTLTLATTAQVVTADNVTTRQAVNGGAHYRLTDAAGRVLAEGQVDAFSAYGTAGTTVATSAAETDAHARLAVMLADQVVTRLLAAPLP